MEKQFLLEDETVLMTSDDSSVVLTNYRLLKDIRMAGESYFMSMHLQNISTIQISSKSRPWLIVLGVLSTLAGALTAAKQNDEIVLVIGIVAGLVFILLYILTRYHVVNIRSNGGSGMYFKTKGMKREVVLGLVTKIDQAKHLIK